MNTNSINILWYFFLSDCNQIWTWSTRFSKNPQHKTEQKILSSGSRNCSTRKDEQTGRRTAHMTQRMVAFPSCLSWAYRSGSYRNRMATCWLDSAWDIGTNKWPTTVNMIMKLRVSYRGADKSLALPGWKNNWKVTILRPTRKSVLPRRPGWTDNLLNFFWVACKS